MAEQLRTRIADGTWPLGTRIPAEHQLTQSLGVSRSTVREALRALVHSGLLEARAGDGTYVRAASELGVILGRRISAGSLRDAFEVRALLEREGARRAASRATDEQVATLRKLLDERNRAKDEGGLAEFADADLVFHEAVVAASGNALLAELYAHISGPVLTTIRESAAQHEDGAVHALHGELLEAIAARDPESAEAAATALLDEGLAALPEPNDGDSDQQETR